MIAFERGQWVLTVASLQLSHFTTCWSRLVDMSILEPQTLQAISLPVPDAATAVEYDGGMSTTGANADDPSLPLAPG